MVVPIEAARTLPARSLDFWFDYTCPYAYLASVRARPLAARMGVALSYRPFLLGGVLRAVQAPQNLGATRTEARRAHDDRDQQRSAAALGITLRMPPAHPLRSVEALRATLAVGVDPAVVDGFFRAYWVEGRAISSAEVIADVVGAAGHDAAAVLAVLEAAATKDDLRRRTDEAIALGIFGAPAWVVDGEHIYWGEDRLLFVEGVRPDASGLRASAERLDVYWDFASPFGYLGAAGAVTLAARTGVAIAWHPVLLGGLFRAIGTSDVPFATFSPAKQRYILKDLARWAEYRGVPFRFPSRFPVSSLRALRVYLALDEAHRAAYRDAVFRAAWADDRDIGDDAVLAGCIGDVAAARDALERAGSDAIKAMLRASTDAAAARGVFGVPSFVVSDELFWGQDRLELALGR